MIERLAGVDAERFLNSMRDAFVAVDDRGALIAWNDAAEAMFGYPRSAALGSDMADLIVPPGMRAAHRSAVERFAETRIPQVSGGYHEFDAMHQDGHTFPVEITHWQLDTDDGLVFYAFMRDISPRRAREQELMRRRAREAELTHRTLHDGLTELPNRTFALERLVYALRRRERYRGDLAVLFVDLDRFKLINDSLGHDAGDQMLRVIAQRLSQTVRAADLVARVSGDEFVVVCDELDDRAEAMMIAHRILDVVQQPVELAGELARVRASIGVAFAAHDAPADATGAAAASEMAEDLLRDSDAAMYRAKERGRGQIAVFDSDMRRQLRNELRMEREVLECLDREELQIWYRPVVDLQHGAVVGAQPMIMWQHPRLGMLEPASFTPVAEEVGAMQRVLAWAMLAICEQFRVWRAAERPTVMIDVDLTARQITHPDFVDSLATALHDTSTPPAALTINLLPTATLPESGDEELTGTLDRLRAMGVGVGINGCGIESAVLSWLAEVPFDVLKIAPQFGLSIGARPRADAVVSALVHMGHDLGTTVSIDGVATAAQRDLLARLGCNLAQGPLFGHAVPAQDLTFTGRSPGDFPQPVRWSVGDFPMGRAAGAAEHAK